MPMLTGVSDIEMGERVAPRRASPLYRSLHPVLLASFRRFGPMTSRQVADYLYWGISPHRRARVAWRWRATASELSATRRAIARLVAAGKVRHAGRVGRWLLYSVAGR